MHVLSAFQGLAMSSLSFVNSDGSHQSDSLNKKLVRDHVTKYFHPRKQVKGRSYGKTITENDCTQDSAQFPAGIRYRRQLRTSSNDGEEELEDPAFPDTITTSAQTSDQGAAPQLTDQVSPDEV